MNSTRRIAAIGIADVIGVLVMYIILTLAADMSWRVWANVVPASYWFDVRSVEVADSPPDKPVILEVDRIIHRPFRGIWTVDVERLGRRGFYSACSASGSNNYNPNNIFPEPLTLDWWTWPRKCALVEGIYQIETRWTIEAPGYPSKEVVVVSNSFMVK